MKRRRLFSDTENRDPPDIDLTKLPAQGLLKTSDLQGPQDAKPWKEVLIVLAVDILLLAVKDCEFLSCVSMVADIDIRRIIDGKTYANLTKNTPT